ncbi:MAG: cation diffusion facilitator family transporter [Coriobacteriales bacterium]|nr:cation diffusion facilitator family transporter [Coriobacteriales bacterium]
MDGRVPNRDQVIIRTSAIGICANVLLAAVKVTAGLIAGSIAVVLDAVNNVSDALSSVITIVGTRLAGKPPDRKHPYGYGRIEYFSTLLISIVITYAGITALSESVKAILEPDVPEYTPVTLVIICTGIVVKLILSTYVLKTGRAVGSNSLLASGTEQRLDAAVSTATLIAALIFVTTGVSIEAWLAAGISLLLIKSGVEQLREAISEILGERPEADVSQTMRQTIASVEGVEGVYDLLIADYGPDRVMASCHVMVPDTMDASHVDLLMRKVAERVYAEHNVIMTAVGVYSRNTTSDEAKAMHKRVAACVRKYEHVVEMHGFYVDFAEKVLRFDLVVDFEVHGRTAYYEQVLDEIQAMYPDFKLMTTLDADYTD